MKSLTLFLLTFLPIFSLDNPVHAQKERTYNWAWGVNRGLNFPAGASPNAVGGRQITNTEGGSAISDLTGNLLFYTDGGQIWRGSDDNLMQTLNIGGAVEYSTVHQNGLIVPYPGSATDYWIFTSRSPGGAFQERIYKTRYRPSTNTVVSGPTIMFAENMMEGMTAVQHSNGTDYWLCLHVKQYGGFPFHHDFLVFPITAGGVGASVAHDKSAVSSEQIYGQGGLKFSNDGLLLAFTHANSGKVEVYDFDDATGVIGSNVFALTGQGNPMGLEFAPSTGFLYVNTTASGEIKQYDATTGALNYTEAAGSGTSALQLGPDCMIYYSRSASGWVGRIEAPDVSGAAATFNNTFYATGIGFGMPNFVSSFLTSCNTPLSLTWFHAVKDGERAKISWESVEVNTDYFIVERSLDGQYWESIIQMEGIGSPDKVLSYEAYDENPALGINYYRIREVGYDDHEEVSDPKMINFYGQVNDIKVYAISQDKLKLSAYTDKDDIVKVEVHNILGGMIHTEMVEIPYGHSDFWFDLKGNSKGVYLVTVSNASGYLAVEKVIFN